MGLGDGRMVLTTSSTAWTDTSKYTVVAWVQLWTGLTSFRYVCNSCLVRWCRAGLLEWGVSMARIPEKESYHCEGENKNLASSGDFRLLRAWSLLKNIVFSLPQSAEVHNQLMDILSDTFKIRRWYRKQIYSDQMGKRLLLSRFSRVRLCATP